MTNKDVVIKVLNEHPCLTAMEVRQFAKRLCNYDITPQAVAGTMKPLIAAGLAACGVRIVIKIIMHKLESSPSGLDFFYAFGWIGLRRLPANQIGH